MLPSTWDHPVADGPEAPLRGRGSARTFLTDFNQFYSAELAPFGDRMRAIDLSILEAGKPVEMPK